MDKVTIIIPVYNTVKYVDECIQSVLKQDYPNLEIILVNDGSTDNSLLVLNKYKVKYPNVIKVIDKQNEGVDKARKTGVDNMTGNYVMFVDSDDTLAPNAVNKLYTTLKTYDVDMVSSEAKRFGHYFVKQLTLSKSAIPYYHRKLMHEEMMNELYLSFFGINILNVALWGKLYKASLFENWQPTGLRFGEDLAANMFIFPRIQSMYMLEDRLYNYRVGGVTAHYMPFFLEHCKTLYKIKKRELINNNFYKKGFQSVVGELKNELKSHIEQVICYKRYKDAEWLKTELCDPVYDDFNQLLADGYKPKRVIDEYLYNRDAEKAWKYMVAHNNSWRLKNIIRRIKSKL